MGANQTEAFPNPVLLPKLTVTGLLKSQAGLIEHFRASALAIETMALTDRVLGLSDAAARTVAIPGAAPAGTLMSVVDTSGSATAGHTITITPASGNISGAGTAVITPGTNSAIQLVSDGTNWWIIAKI